MKIAQLQTVESHDNLFHGGIEPEYRKDRRKHIIVQDNYDFVGNNAIDVSAVAQWHNGFKKKWFKIDYRAFKDHIKAIVDLVGFGQLPANEQRIAAQYNIGTVVEQRDVATDEDELQKWGNRFGKQVSKARTNRVIEATTVLFKNVKGVVVEVAPSTFVPALLIIISEMGNLLDMYENRGLVSLAEDGTEGIEDFIVGTTGTSFAGNGLKDKTWDLVSNSPFANYQELADELRDIIVLKGSKL